MNEEEWQNLHVALTQRSVAQIAHIYLFVFLFKYILLFGYTVHLLTQAKNACFYRHIHYEAKYIMLCLAIARSVARPHVSIWMIHMRGVINAFNE